MYVILIERESMISPNKIKKWNGTMYYIVFFCPSERPDWTYMSWSWVRLTAACFKLELNL